MSTRSLTLKLMTIALAVATGASLAPVAAAAPVPDGLGLNVDVDLPGADPGLILLAPKDETNAKPASLEVVDNHGRALWHRELPAGQQAYDFRQQTYRGRPVLTWWQGASTTGPGHGEGVDYIADLRGNIIATVNAGGGLQADQHEFTLTPRGTALITVYTIVPYDLSAVGGPKQGQVLDSIAEEVDVATGRVLLTWDGLQHVPVTDSHAPLSLPYDYLHLNAVSVADDGSLLVSARHTWAIYDVDRRTGAVRWQLGGRHSDFAGAAFEWQHNPVMTANGEIRIFDNENTMFDSHGPTRIIWLRLDVRRHTATQVRELQHPDGIQVQSQGSAQELPGGHTFVDWGQSGRVSEFSAAGRLLFDATLPAGFDSYRGYRISR